MEKNLEKVTKGLGLAFEVIVVVEFLKEVYQYLKPKVKKCMAAHRKEEKDDQPQEPEFDGGEAAVNEPEK